MRFFLSILFTLLISISPTLYGQQYNWKQQRISYRVISSAVPLMTIAPDARAAALGDIGVSTDADINSAYWNVGKLAMIDRKLSIGFTYTPWKTEGFGTTDIYNASSILKIGQKHAIGLSTSIFAYHYDNIINLVHNYKLREYYITGSYSYQILNNMGIGISLKFINTNVPVRPDSWYPIVVVPDQTGAIDLGWYWNVSLSQKSDIAIGVSANNIGSGIRYSEYGIKKPLPANIRIGSTYKYRFNEAHTLSFGIEFMKLMVPSPPEYATDNNGFVIIENGDPVIARGRNPNRSLTSSIIGSFYDAPGGINEEFQEIQVGSGLEYWYKDKIALRGGYSWESFEKGDRKYFTTGIGLKFDIVGVDVSYLIPQNSDHPLKETVRFSASIKFGEIQND